MKKTRKLLIFTTVLVLVFMGLMLIIADNKVKVNAEESTQTETPVSTSDLSYLSYVSSKTTYHQATYSSDLYPVLDNPIYIFAEDYVKAESSITESYGNKKYIEEVVIADDATYSSSNSAANGKTKIVIQRGGDITYTVDVPQSGFYNLYLTYYTITGLHSNIDRTLKINGDYPFEDAESITFTRVWQDEALEKNGVVYNTVQLVTGDNNLSYSKLWRKDVNDNDIKPQQVEILGEKVTAPFKDSMGYVTEPFMFYFEKGTNKITLGSTKEYFAIDSIELRSVSQLASYSEYEASLLAEANVSSREQLINLNVEGSYTVIQAEASTSKSSPTLYPQTDRSDPLTEPYSVTKTLLNSIGGSSWNVLGDWIEWTFEVPNDGYYEISMRAKQNVVRGMFSTRAAYLAEYDETTGAFGEYQTLFDGMDNIQIGYDRNWKNVTLGNDDGSYLFYFKKGVKYSFKMEVTLGDYAPLISELQDMIDELSEIYRDIIAYTTISPDTGRDYQLKEKFPHLFYGYNEETQSYDIENEGDFYRILNELTAISDEIKEISGGASDKTGVIDSVVVILQKMIDKPRTIPQRLSTYSTNVSSLGSLLNELREAPLEIDYLEIHTPDVELPKAKAGFFKGLWTDVVKFFASFFINYETISNTEETSEEDITIEVWMTLGRDQANVIRNLIDTSFSGENGYAVEHFGKNINIDLKLTGSDVLLKATLAGIGPDVALNVDSSLPVNYALRNAVLDLTLFDDFWDVVYAIPDGYTLDMANDPQYSTFFADDYENVYMASSLRQFQFSGTDTDESLFNSATTKASDLKNSIKNVYALPEKQVFLMMFVRDDLIDEYIPDDYEGTTDDYLDNMTWSDMLDMVAKLQAKQLQFYLPVNDSGATALNPIYVSLLYQYGGDLYVNDNTESGLQEDAAMQSFEFWTELYTNYSFPTSASFVNRFRTGEMPIGISYYEMYNTLSVFAPELKGKWSFHLIPGYEKKDANGNYVLDENGNVVIDHTATASGTGAVILKQNALTGSSKLSEKERLEDKAWAAWTFLKWWTNYDSQYKFGTEMEGILGSSARHTTANVLALDSLAWPTKDKEMLMKQWSQVHEMPQIAGSYITGREIENAYREVINNYYNPREILYKYSLVINKEIERKRDEFKDFIEETKEK